MPDVVILWCSGVHFTDSKLGNEQYKIEKSHHITWLKGTSIIDSPGTNSLVARNPRPMSAIPSPEPNDTTSTPRSTMLELARNILTAANRSNINCCNL